MTQTDYAVAPGEVLFDELLARCAERCGLPQETVEAVVCGNQPVTEDIAEALERGLGIRACLWLNLERNYQRDKREAEGAP